MGRSQQSPIRNPQSSSAHARDREACGSRTMPQSELDTQIDRLYQLPVDQFTARNTLAEVAKASTGGEEIQAGRRRCKWAINQVYWHASAYARSHVDRRAAQRARGRDLGKHADLRAAGKAHEDIGRRAEGARRCCSSQASSHRRDQASHRDNAARADDQWRSAGPSRAHAPADGRRAARGTALRTRGVWRARQASARTTTGAGRSRRAARQGRRAGEGDRQSQGRPRRGGARRDVGRTGREARRVRSRAPHTRRRARESEADRRQAGARGGAGSRGERRTGARRPGEKEGRRVTPRTAERRHPRVRASADPGRPGRPRTRRGSLTQPRLRHAAKGKHSDGVRGKNPDTLLDHESETCLKSS